MDIKNENGRSASTRRLVAKANHLASSMDQHQAEQSIKPPVRTERSRRGRAGSEELAAAAEAGVRRVRDSVALLLVFVEVGGSDGRSSITAQVVRMAEADALSGSHCSGAEREADRLLLMEAGVASRVRICVVPDGSCVGLVESVKGDPRSRVRGDEGKCRAVRVVVGDDYHRHVVVIVSLLVRDLLIGRVDTAERLVVIRVNVPRVADVAQGRARSALGRNVRQDEGASLLDVRGLADLQTAAVARRGRPGNRRIWMAPAQAFFDTARCTARSRDVDGSCPVVVPFGTVEPDSPGIDWTTGCEHVTVVLAPAVVLRVRDESQASAVVPIGRGLEAAPTGWPSRRPTAMTLPRM